MGREETTTRDRRPGRSRRTVSISARNRGQTTQDFAVGIGVFILAVAFVFGFLPTILTPFDSTVSGGDTAQADRIADRLVHDLSGTTDASTEINGTAFRTIYVEDDDGNLSERAGLRANGDRVYDRVNVTIEQLDGTPVSNQDDWSAGETYRGESAAGSARIVTVENGPGDCDPACRLVVRVW